MIMIMMKPYLIITVLGTLTSSTLLQRAIAEEDATCALLGQCNEALRRVSLVV